MENYKQEMDRITAPGSLRARIEAIPQENAPRVRARRSPRKIAAIAAVLVVVLIGGTIALPALFSMQKSAMYDAAPRAAEQKAYSYNGDFAADSAAGYASYDGAAEYELAPAEAAKEGSSAKSGSVLPTGRKLIRDATLEMETKDFDAFLKSLRKQTSAFAGYTERSSVGENYDGTRHGNIVVRVPADKLDEFLDGLDGVGTVTSREESLRDVTQEYIDMESRIRALETEQKTLLELLGKAEELTDVLEIQNRLSEVRATLESYKGQMQALENQIDYSSVTIYIEEVKRYTPAEKKSFFSQLRSNLSENFYSVGQGLRNFALNLLSSLPYLLVIAVIAAIAVVLIVLIRRKRRRMK